MEQRSEPPWSTISTHPAHAASLSSSRVCGCRGSSVLRQRLGAAFTAAVATGMESLAFWFDVLWLHGTWVNRDVRYRPYAVTATGIMVAGSLGFCVLSVLLLFSNVRGNKQALLDWRVVRASEPGNRKPHSPSRSPNSPSIARQRR